MPRNADRLRLMQMLSPAFPVGSYAYSQGLEQAITDGAVHSSDSLTQWISAVLTHGSARMDAILLAHGRGGADLCDLAYAYASSAERVTEMREQGAAFGQVIGGITGDKPPALPYALALADATRSLDLPTEDILALFLQALAAQMVSAAVRFVPLKAADGQRVLAGLADTIIELAARYATEPLTALSSATLGADLAQMRHETMEVRIYRT
ncbi:MAG: urease accessory protein UreF [Pseudorhodobacter sp.]|nr:urease accessory protein UreF [Pseudorhodobacter sp.]